MNALNFLAAARVARGPGARVARAHLARVCFDDALRCVGLFMLLSVRHRALVSLNASDGGRVLQ